MSAMPLRARATFRQGGAVLLLVLILLTVFLLALTALVSSTFTNLAGVGNYVYHEGGLAVTDSVVTDAKAFLRTAADLGVATANQYSPTPLAVSANGVPTNPCTGGGWSCVAADTTTYPGYSVQYFIERLCNAAGPVTVTTAPPMCQPGRPGGLGSALPVYDRGAGGGARILTVSVLYRVTVMVTGPRNTTVITQTVISKSV